MTAASIGAGVALHIAKRIYPVQKEKDREIKIDEEKRVVFSKYLKSVESLANNLYFPSKTDGLNHAAECKAALNDVYLFANSDSVGKMMTLYNASSALLGAQIEAQRAKTNSVDGESEDESSQLLLAKSFLDAKTRADRAYIEAINSARKELRWGALDATPKMTLFWLPHSTKWE